MQKAKIFGNCEKKCELSKSYLKVYGRLNGMHARDQCSGGAAPVQQIKSQVKSFSVLTSLVECQMSMYQELIIEMDIKNS